jgi:hypothetical protein
MKHMIGLILLCVFIPGLRAQTQTLNLLSPNGGEVWTVGSGGQLHFTYTQSGIVNLSLLKGEDKQVIMTKPNIILRNGPGEINELMSLLADIEPGNDYKIRIQAGVNYVDTSEGYFSIISPQSNNESSNPAQPSLTYSVYPNPFRNYTCLKLDSPLPEEVTVDVYNTKGQLVKNLVSGYQIEQEAAFCWDGKDADGHRVEKGVYFYKIIMGKKVSTIKIIMMK